MASPVNAALCALIATAFWTWLGYALGRHLFPRVLAIGAAPVIGWAVHSAAMLPIYRLDRIFAARRHRSRCALGAGRRLVAAATRSGGRRGASPRHSAMGLRRRGGSRAGAGRRHPSQIFRRCRAARRPDLRPCQDRDHRCDGAARPAPGQSGVRRTRHAGPPRLLLSLAFQRGRSGAGAFRERLGSRYRTDVVCRFRVAELDDGACRLAQQAIRRRDLGRRARRRGFAVADARLDFPRRRSHSVSLAADRNGRLAVSGHMGSPTSDGGVVRRRGHAAYGSIRAAAERGAHFDAGSWSSSPASKARPLSAASRSRSPLWCGARPASPQRTRRGACALPSAWRPQRYSSSASSRRSFTINSPRCERAATAARLLSPITQCSANCFRGAAPPARHPGLLAHHPADRIAGHVFRRDHRACRGAAQRLAAGGKTRDGELSHASPAPALSSRGFWSPRLATTTISACARSFPPRSS